MEFIDGTYVLTTTTIKIAVVVKLSLIYGESQETGNAFQPHIHNITKEKGGVT